ncbi:transferrin receptor protein 1 [Striga asiatica]|uniref:Transferrin receptor protein 1 n=1 Tax=Striga asiatica TaxID=4170 RepID=A0A5A7QKS2_STRAF|nr:transferrin receptor protein 1 [Striga asiatica]
MITDICVYSVQCNLDYQIYQQVFLSLKNFLGRKEKSRSIFRYQLIAKYCRYNPIGSTEWVEENRQMLASRAVTYLNLDVAVAGPQILPPSATPQLDDLLAEAAKQV